MCLPKVTQCRVRSKHPDPPGPNTIRTAKTLDEAPYPKKKNKCCSVLRDKILNGANRYGNASHKKNIKSLSKSSVCKRVKKHASKVWNRTNENEHSPGFFPHRSSFSILQYLAPTDDLSPGTAHKFANQPDNTSSRPYCKYSGPQNYVRLSIGSLAKNSALFSISTQNADELNDFASPLLGSQQSELHDFKFSPSLKNTHPGFQFTSASFNDSGWGSMSPMLSEHFTTDQSTTMCTHPIKRRVYQTQADSTVLYDATLKSMSKSETQLRVAVERYEMNLLQSPGKSLYQRKPETSSWRKKYPLDNSLDKTSDRTVDFSSETQFCTSKNAPRIPDPESFNLLSKPGRRMSYESWQRPPLYEGMPARSESTISMPTPNKRQKAFPLPPLFVTRRVIDDANEEDEPLTNEKNLYFAEERLEANRDTVHSNLIGANLKEKFASTRPKPLDTSKRSIRQVKRNSVHSRSSEGSQEDLDGNFTLSSIADSGALSEQNDISIGGCGDMLFIDQQSEKQKYYFSTTEEEKHPVFPDSCTSPKLSQPIHISITTGRTQQSCDSLPARTLTKLDQEVCTGERYSERETLKAPRLGGNLEHLRGLSLTPTKQLSEIHPDLGYKCVRTVKLDTKTPTKPTAEGKMPSVGTENSAEPMAKQVSTYDLAPGLRNLNVSPDRDLDFECKDSLAFQPAFADSSKHFDEISGLEEECLSSTICDAENSSDCSHPLDNCDELVLSQLETNSFDQPAPLIQSTFLNSEYEFCSGMLMIPPETLKLELHNRSEILEQTLSDELRNEAQLSSIVTTDSDVENLHSDILHGQGNGDSQLKHLNIEDDTRDNEECLSNPTESVTKTSQNFTECLLSTSTEAGDVINHYDRFDESDSGLELSLSSGYIRPSISKNSGALPEQNVAKTQAFNPSCVELKFGFENQHFSLVNDTAANLNDQVIPTSVFRNSVRCQSDELESPQSGTQQAINQPYAVSSLSGKECELSASGSSKLETPIQRTVSDSSMTELPHLMPELVQTTLGSLDPHKSLFKRDSLELKGEYGLKTTVQDSRSRQPFKTAVQENQEPSSRHIHSSCIKDASKSALDLNSNRCNTSAGKISINEYLPELKVEWGPREIAIEDELLHRRLPSNNVDVLTVAYTSPSPSPTEPTTIEIGQHSNQELHKEGDAFEHRLTGATFHSTSLVEGKRDNNRGVCVTVETIKTEIAKRCEGEESSKDTSAARSPLVLSSSLGSLIGLGQASTKQHAQYTLHTEMDNGTKYSGDCKNINLPHCSDVPEKESKFEVLLLPTNYSSNLALLEEQGTVVDSQVQEYRGKSTPELVTTKTTCHSPAYPRANLIQRSVEMVDTDEGKIHIRGSEATLGLVAPLQQNKPQKLETKDPSNDWSFASLDSLRIDNEPRLILRNNEFQRTLALNNRLVGSSLQTGNSFDDKLESEARGSPVHKLPVNSGFSVSTTTTRAASTERSFKFELSKQCCSEIDIIDDKIGYTPHDSKTRMHAQEHSDSHTPRAAPDEKNEIKADSEQLLIESLSSLNKSPNSFDKISSDREAAPEDAVLFLDLSSTVEAFEEKSITCSQSSDSYDFKTVELNLTTSHTMNATEGISTDFPGAESIIHSQWDQNADRKTKFLQTIRDLPHTIPSHNQISTRGIKPSALSLYEILSAPRSMDGSTHDVPTEETFGLSKSTGNDTDWQGGELIVLAKQNIVIQTQSNEDSDFTDPRYATGPSGDELPIASPCFDQPSEINMFLKESEIIPTYIRPTYSAPFAGLTNVQNVIEGVPLAREVSIACSEQMLSNEFNTEVKEVASSPFIESSTEQPTLGRIVLIHSKVEDLQSEEMSTPNNVQLSLGTTFSESAQSKPFVHEDLAVTATRPLVIESTILPCHTESTNPVKLLFLNDSSSTSSTKDASPQRTVIAKYHPPQTLCNEVEEGRTEMLTEDFSIESAIAAPRQWNLLDRWSAWTFASLTSTFHFATIYIPRHVYWFYMATFESRDQLLRAMAGRSLNLAVTWSHIQATLRNPIFVASIFLGLTTLSPRIQHWPDGAQHLLMCTRFHLLPLWVNSRPALSYVGHIILSYRTALLSHRALAMQSPFR